MNILLKPIVTEKMTAQGEAHNRYGFVVDKNANKLEIKKAVEELYDVKVSEVNTMRYGGKRKARFTKSGVSEGKTSSYKKAIVTLEEGEVIDFYSNI
ncbi:MAG: 50S ribosomal protein L23 [Bacteroidales bacterium]|nr:50S ribosomal protein L23 [Bacteroidales bacterium]MBN2698135.1 50S ribosomal protein L23 [Bacteroidales bacterium]